MTARDTIAKISWIHSTIHNTSCKVIEEQVLWDKAVCRVWLPSSNAVIKVSKDSLKPIVFNLDPEIEKTRIGYVASAARVADALENSVDREEGPVLLSPMDSSAIPIKKKLQSTQDIHSQFIQETQRAYKKDGPVLMATAKNKWSVSDPNEAEDWEKVREKSLLKDFEQYLQSSKKLKVFRLEAVMTGFKKSYREKNYQIIIDVAKKIPGSILEEDPKLLLGYDQAVTRTGGE